MDDLVRIFKSPTGDVYHISLVEDEGLLSTEALQAIGPVRLVGIELRRLAGRHTTSLDVLTALEQHDVIICYYCDFINPIPRTSKNSMPPQEYRSRLFDRMFQRYTRHHGLRDVRLSVVEINGVNEKYYFHVIYRERHSLLATIISTDLKEGFGK